MKFETNFSSLNKKLESSEGEEKLSLIEFMRELAKSPAGRALGLFVAGLFAWGASEGALGKRAEAGEDYGSIDYSKTKKAIGKAMAERVEAISKTKTSAEEQVLPEDYEITEMEDGSVAFKFVVNGVRIEAKIPKTDAKKVDKPSTVDGPSVVDSETDAKKVDKPGTVGGPTKIGPGENKYFGSVHKR